MTRVEKIQELSGDTRVKLSIVVMGFLLLVSNLGGVIMIYARDINFRNEVLNFRKEVASDMEKAAAHRLQITTELNRLEKTKRDKGVHSWNRDAMTTWSIDLEAKSGHEVPDPNNLKYYSVD